MKQILPEEAYKNLQDYVLLDVRTKEEYQESHLEGSINIDVDDLVEKKFDVNKLPKDKAYLIYCHTGARSYGACLYLDQLGFKTTNLIGGTEEWKSKNLPLAK